MQTNRKYDYTHTHTHSHTHTLRVCTPKMCPVNRKNELNLGYATSSQGVKARQGLRREEGPREREREGVGGLTSVWHNLNSCQFDKVTHEGRTPSRETLINRSAGGARNFYAIFVHYFCISFVFTFVFNVNVNVICLFIYLCA